MPVLLVDSGTSLKLKKDDPPSFQTYDLFEDYFPSDIQTHLRNLNQERPLKGLMPFIAGGEISKGQWLLYTVVCFSGQVLNGGTEQFFDNCPGLICDAQRVFSEFASTGLQDAYGRASAPFVGVIERFAAVDPNLIGEELNEFYGALEVAWDEADENAMEEIDSSAYSDQRDKEHSNWFTDLDLRVIDWVLSNPGQFRRV